MILLSWANLTSHGYCLKLKSSIIFSRLETKYLGKKIMNENEVYKPNLYQKWQFENIDIQGS